MNRNKLCLLWQNQQSRNWYYIGDLIYENNKYFFKYQTETSKRNVYEALANGYRLHPTFSDVNQKYESRVLFSAFARRLPDMNREDYLPTLINLGITQDSSDFEIMSITGGTMNSDNYEFLKPIIKNDTDFKLEFYLRGWRHYDLERTNNLKDGDELSLVMEADNEYDEDAVAIYKNNETIVGYVPAFYSSFITQMLKAKEKGKDVEYKLNYTFNSEVPSHFKVPMSILISDYADVLNTNSEKFTELTK